MLSSHLPSQEYRSTKLIPFVLGHSNNYSTLDHQSPKSVMYSYLIQSRLHTSLFLIWLDQSRTVLLRESKMKTSPQPWRETLWHAEKLQFIIKLPWLFANCLGCNNGSRSAIYDGGRNAIIDDFSSRDRVKHTVTTNSCDGT